MAWGLLRLPLLAVLAYLLRDPLIDAIEATVGIEGLTEFTIALLSTPLSRLLIALGFALAMLGLLRLLRDRLSDHRLWLASLAFAALLLTGFFLLSGTHPLKALLPLALVAANLYPGRGTGSPAWAAWAPGIAEVFRFADYIRWLRSVTGRSGDDTAPTRPGDRLQLPALLLAGAAAAGLTAGPWLVDKERALRMPDEVRLLARDNINGLAWDPGTGALYVTGHGLQHLQRRDLRAGADALQRSPDSTGGAQGLFLDAASRRVYLFNLRTRELMVLDADSLRTLHRWPVPEVSPGDPWVVADAATHTVVIASEADQREGSPFVVVDSRSGAVLDRRPLDAGNLLLDAATSSLYLSFFRHSNEVLRYDLRRREVVQSRSTHSRVDRMAIDSRRQELLLASPLGSRVLRYGLDDLAPRGAISSVFGVRVMALDETRQWMLTASLATGQLEVLDMESGRSLRRIYLGPWLRSVVLDTASATAYVSANGALYQVPYGPGN